MTGDYFTAEDLTQDTFIAVYKNWKSFDGVNEKTWICRIATNKCIDYERAAARKVIALEEEMVDGLPDTSNPQDEVINRDIIDSLERSIDTLEEPYKSVARNYFIGGKSAKEISGETDVGLKTIQTQIYRARSRLKEMIRKEDLIS